MLNLKLEVCMTKDCHYYAVLAFARAMGFKKEIAHKIAYASQFVDDAKINHITLKRNFETLEYININGEPSFYNMSTCHCYFKMKTYNYSAMTANTAAFHFVPGGGGSTFTRKMRCKQENPVIAEIIELALKEDNPVKFGMLLHSFADTFAHQGFSGIVSKVNDIKECKAKIRVRGENLLKKWCRNLLLKTYDKCFDLAIPAYGHGQAANFPDEPYLKWSYKYEYLDEDNHLSVPAKIDNPKRYVAAYYEIQHLLERFLDMHPQFKDDEFESISCKKCYKLIIKKAAVKRRIKNWQKFMLKNRMFEETDPVLYYDEEAWLKAAFADYQKNKYDARKVENAKLRLDFADTNWYQFYKAVHWYKPLFFAGCKKHGVDIPNEYI